MKIEMTETVQGSLDGLTVQKLVKGHEYDTVDSPRGERLAKYHVEEMGHAVYAKEKSAPEAAPEPEPAEKAVAKGRK
jgi:hypothetical protein